MTARKRFHIVIAIICLCVIACASPPKVKFETPVDTRSKKIYTQQKKTYQLNDIGLYISNEFDGARLNNVSKVNDTLVDLHFYPENAPINNSAYYAFKVWSDTPKTIYFSFNYPKDYDHRYIPKLKEDGTWKIVDSTQVIEHNKKTTVRLNISKNTKVVAAQEIQSSTDVKEWYLDAINGKESYVQIDEFGKSTLGRTLPVINIGNGNKEGKDVIVLLTRQHPPEVTGFFAFKTFLKTILKESDLSKTFLDKYHVIAFPIMNPDGVDLGHWRHNANGIDTNRDWSVYRQKEVKQATKYINDHLKNYNAHLVLGLDFHSTYEDVFYTNEIREGTAGPEFIDAWFTALEANISDYKVNEASSNSTRPVSKGWFLYGHKAVGITYEIGDQTPKDRINEIAETSAKEMMKILLK